MTSEIKAVKVAYSEFPPFVEIRQNENGQDIIEGLMPDLIRSVADWMDLSLHWIRDPDDRYGTWENNTWNGMCGMLYRNEVDLIANPLLPSSEYAEVAFYTNPVIYEAFTLLSGKEKMDGGFFLYFSVLEPIVWASIGAALLIMVFVSVILYRKGSDLPESWTSASIEYLWLYVAYMLRQVPNEKWVFISSKRRSLLLPLVPLLVTLWVIGVAFLIMTVFQSLLVSKLTIVRSQPVVSSLEDFVAKKKVIGRAPFEIELHEVLKGSNIPVYEETWKKLEPKLVDIEHIFSDDFFEQVEKGKICLFHGLIVFKSVLAERFEREGKCNFYLSERVFFPFPLLVALQKSLPLKFLSKFNYGLTKLVDADLSGKWIKPIFKTSRLCTSYSENILKPLNLQNIYGVLLIWSVGMISSFIVLIIEKMSYTKPRHKFRKRY